jgi:nucleotide-binding universal stress UspA family protein
MSQLAAQSRIEKARRQHMTILLAIDGSKFSEAAIQAVAAQAPRDTKVWVLHVLEPPSMLLGREMGGQEPEFEAVWKARRQQAEALATKASETLCKSGLNATPIVKEGDPKSRIIDLATEWHADLIVLGSHGRRGVNRFLMGSVSEGVVRHASCSVEVVRIPSAPNVLRGSAK